MVRLIGMALLAFASMSTAAFAQLDADSIRFSQWDTVYEAIGGGNVRARLTFEGNGGYYEVSGDTGSLSNVTYDVRIGGGATIRGSWSMGGVDGRFTFFVAGNSNPKVFSGSWQSNGRSGNWRGTFQRIVRPVDSTPVKVTGGGQVVYDETWSYNDNRGYYYKRCTFPAGGYQYLIYYKSKPSWVYWYNPVSEVYWCACPTVRHSKWGNNIRNGEDLFLIATTKAREIEDTEFPDEGDDGANFRKGSAKDKDGSTVNLNCPPPDLP